MIKITNFSDGGHSWFSVKRKLLIELDILNQISSYSYQKGTMVYLEEDCDWQIFVNTYLDKSFKIVTPENRFNLVMLSFKFKDSYSKYSPVRNYEAFSSKVNKE
jgi:hypothetical protein